MRPASTRRARPFSSIVFFATIAFLKKSCYSPHIWGEGNRFEEEPRSGSETRLASKLSSYLGSRSIPVPDRNVVLAARRSEPRP
jgi:hypothetical protein